MSREKMTSWTPRFLKFKVWDIVANKWITNWQEQAGNSPICFLPEEMMEDNQGPTVQFFDSYNGSPYRFIQYTGLKDINDIEIYEGDILTLPTTIRDWGEGPFEHGGHPCTVVWKEGVYVWNHDTLDMRLAMDLSVIGNTFENSELLEK